MNKKKLIAIVLAALMSISGSTVAFADNSSAAGSGSAAVVLKNSDAEVVVTDAAGLEAALEAGGKVKLGGNITMDKRHDIVIREDVVLDLNGCTITKSYGGLNHFIFVINGGSLTIEDSKDNGGIDATHSDNGYGIQLKGSGSSFELKSGTIRTTQETVDIYDSATNSNIKISGGSLISTKDNVLGVRGSGTVVKITDGDMRSVGRTGVYISNYGDPDSIQFIMTGGTLTHTGGRSGAIQLYKGATVTIGGTAEIESSSYAVQVQENTVLNVEGGKLSTSGSDAISGGETSSINISGGTISGKYGVCAEDTAAVNISGGTFDVSVGTINGSSGDSPNIQITGGNFNGKDVSEYLPDEGIAVPKVEITASGNVLTANASHPLAEAVFTYQWYKNGVKLEGETSTTLTADEYTTYSVEVVASYQTVTSESASASYKYSEAVPETPDTGATESQEYGDYYGNEKWDEVKKEIAKLIEDEEFGETIEMSATGLPYFPASVARELKGRDITLEIRKNGVTYKVNGLEIGSIDKIWYEFEELETELLTETPGDEEDSSKPADENKTNPSTGR